MAVYFTRPRTQYDPYDDVYRMVTLSGFELRYLDKVDWTASDTVIALVANGEWEGVPTNRRVHLIHWQFERPNPGEALHPKADETWVSDAALARSIGARYVFFGGHPLFSGFNETDKHWDIVTLMAWFGRRMDLLTAIKNSGLSLADPPTYGGHWGEKRVERLTGAQVLLTCHQDEKQWCEPIRFCLAGMWALPIVTETCADAGIWNDLILQAPMGELVDTVKLLLTDPVRQVRMGAAAWRLCCVERTFRQEVERALERVTA